MSGNVILDNISHNTDTSILSETYQNVGEGFKEILNVLSEVSASNDTFAVQDTLAIQQAIFKYTMYQEMVTKIASKSANAINEVMKAQ